MFPEMQGKIEILLPSDLQFIAIKIKWLVAPKT